MWSSIAALILALLKLAPSLYTAVDTGMQRERAARAETNRQAKDARVDAAIKAAQPPASGQNPS